MQVEHEKRLLLTDDGELTEPQDVGRNTTETFTNHTKRVPTANPEIHNSAVVFLWAIWDSFGVVAPLLILFLIVPVGAVIFLLLTAAINSLGLLPTLAILIFIGFLVFAAHLYYVMTHTTS
jgi:hypothetical protein